TLEARVRELEARIVDLEGDLAHERFEHNATRGFYRRAIESVNGVLTAAERKLIRGCLHPDEFKDEATKKRYEQAFQIFEQCGELIVKKGERGPSGSDRPMTREDYAAMKRQATAKRRPNERRANHRPPNRGTLRHETEVRTHAV